MTCPPCNHNCNQGRECPSRRKIPMPKKYLYGFLVLFLSLGLLTGCHSTVLPEDGPPRVYHVSGFDPGGSVPGRYAHAAELERAGSIVVVDTPSLYSAGTFYLALPNACVTPRTVAHFHGPANGAIQLLFGVPVPAGGEAGREARQMMVDMFRELPQLQAFVAEGIHSTRFRSLDYQQLVSMGVRPCTDVEIQLARNGRVVVELE